MSLPEIRTKPLVRLDLPQQPASYIASACGDDGSGEVLIQVRNETSVPVKGVQVQYQYIDAAGNERRRTQEFSGQLAPGKVASARTGQAPYAGTRCASAVVSATIAE